MPARGGGVGGPFLFFLFVFFFLRCQKMIFLSNLYILSSLWRLGVVARRGRGIGRLMAASRQTCWASGHVTIMLLLAMSVNRFPADSKHLPCYRGKWVEVGCSIAARAPCFFCVLLKMGLGGVVGVGKGGGVWGDLMENCEMCLLVCFEFFTVRKG